jgi:serine/threonine protein kinase
MYILLTGTPPFNGKNDREIMERVKQGKFSMTNPVFKNISASGKDLLQKMLTYDYHKRLSAEDCYNHAWFKKENMLEKSKINDGTLENFKSFFVSFN